MTLQEFKAAAEAQKYNTCNGWGFGGDFGKTYTLGKLYFRHTKYSSRHQGSWDSSRYRIEGKQGSDVTKVEFIEALNKL